MSIFPPTSNRVQNNTSDEVNEQIQMKTHRNIVHFQQKNTAQIANRMKQLDREWDTERVLEVTASSFVILGTILGFTKNKNWHIFSGIIGLFLLQHSLQGWCPPLPVIRRFGIRTASEINEEKNKLQTLLDNHS